MNVMNVLSLLGGLGLFLFGMKIMGDGLEKAAGNRMKKILEMATSNRLLAVLTGLVITAIIQSSSATTVMVVGFVNAGMMSLTQTVGVIMGANIGTTVTSLMLSVELDFAAVFAFLVLILTSFFNEKKHPVAYQLGYVTMGLGILFVGMDTMSTAMTPLRDWQVFKDMMVSFSHPLLGVAAGMIINAVIQSSPASVGILQALAGEGLIPLQSSVFILFGQNIGTCITALIASAGTSTNAKRAAVVHLLFNVIGTLIFVVIACALPFAEWIESLAPGNLRLQIAYTHVTFNVVNTMILLPCAGLLERAACLLVPDHADVDNGMRLKYFDQRMLTPHHRRAAAFQGNPAHRRYCCSQLCHGGGHVPRLGRGPGGRGAQAGRCAGFPESRDHTLPGGNEGPGAWGGGQPSGGLHVPCGQRHGARGRPCAEHAGSC